MNKYLDIKKSLDAIIQEKRKTEQNKEIDNEQKYYQALNAVNSDIYNELNTIGKVFFGETKSRSLLITRTKPDYYLTDYRSGSPDNSWVHGWELKREKLSWPYITVHMYQGYHYNLSIISNTVWGDKNNWALVIQELQKTIDTLNKKLENL